jgi:tetratricopeptide (TPR) repeat protein
MVLNRQNVLCVTVFLALAGALVAVGCEDAAKRFNDVGLQAYYAGKPHEALSAFEEAMSANPDVGEYYFNAAMVEQSLGNIDRALFLYGMATKLDPSITLAYYNMAQCYVAKGSPERALAALETGTQANPYTADAFINVARFHLEQNDLGSARLWLAKAVAAEPESARAHREYGTLLIRLGRRDEGIEHLRKSLSLQPVQPETSARVSEMAPSGNQLPPPKAETE